MLFRNSLYLAIFSLLSQVFGILRDRLLAHYVGVGPTLDVYNAAFRIPDLVLGIMVSFAGALTVIPFITKAIHENNKKDLEERFSSLFIFFGTIMCVLAILVVMLIPYFAKSVVPGFTTEQITSFIFYTRLLMIQPILLGLSALVSTLAQARHQFFLYGSAPLVYTLGIIVSIIFGYEKYGLFAIILGVIIGSFGHLLLQSLTLYHHSVRISFSRFRWTLVKEQLIIAVPRSMSQVVSQLRMVFFTGFATTFGPGALSIYVFAQRITESVNQIISQSISTANLPLLSSQYALGDMPAYRSTFKKNAVVIFSITACAAVVCAALSQVIVYVLYGKVGGAQEIAKLLSLMSIGLPLYAINGYFVTAFNAMKDTRTILVTNIVSTLFAIGVCFIFKEKGYGLMSIGYGTICMSLFYTLILFFLYSRKKHIVS